MKQKRDDKPSFSSEETRHRFEAALRGARIAGPRHKESAAPKRPKPRRQRKRD